MKSLDFVAMQDIQGGNYCYSNCNPCCGGIDINAAVALTLGCLLGVGACVSIRL